MTNKLKKAFDVAAKLPPADRDALAAAILEEVKVDGLWDASFARKPGALERPRVGLSYRALAVREQDEVISFWIGSPADYDDLLSRL